MPGITPRPMPTDFVELAKSMTYDNLRAHYKAGGCTLTRWIREAGLPPRKRSGELPADFAEVAATKPRRDLKDHYRVSENLLTKWIRLSGATPPRATQPAPQRMKPVPDDFLAIAPTMTKAGLERHYSSSHMVVTRWVQESGAVPLVQMGKPKSERTRQTVHGVVRLARYPGQTSISTLRNYGVHDQAADKLRRNVPVYRCDERGRANPKGSLWRIGNTVTDGDGLLAKAARA